MPWIHSEELMPTRNHARADTRCIRLRLDADTHRRLGHVAVDRRASLASLLRDGAQLVLAQHEPAEREDDQLGEP